jgi:hypothetical protein
MPSQSLLSEFWMNKTKNGKKGRMNDIQPFGTI